MSRLGSVRFRITAVSTALVAVTLTLASLLVIDLVRADLLESAEAALSMALEEQARQYGLSGEDMSASGVTELVTEIDFGGEPTLLGLFYEDIGDSTSLGEMYLDDRAIAKVTLDSESGELVAIQGPTGGPIENPEDVAELNNLASIAMETGVSIFSEEGPVQVGAASLREIEDSLNAVRDALLMTVPFLVLAVGCLIWILVGRALRPVLDITDQVEAISSSNLDSRIPVPPTGDEVSELATVMNRMLVRLQAGGERQRQFSADASHELRSPLSTVRAAAELISLNPQPERATRLANEIVAETDRMDELIGDMLDLARLDEVEEIASPEPVDLGELVRSQTERIAKAAPKSIESSIGSISAIVPGNPRQLERLVTNLVENACHHATSRVRVEVRDHEGFPMLIVDDDGPGVPPDKVDQIFQRFGRIDSARGRQDGGAGLGLALVKLIADRHRAMIDVCNGDLGGARFTVRFPYHWLYEPTPIMVRR